MVSAHAPADVPLVGEVFAPAVQIALARVQPLAMLRFRTGR
jgi:hypothetical protein